MGTKPRRLTQLHGQLQPHYAALPMDVRFLAMLDDACYTDRAISGELKRRGREGGHPFAKVFRDVAGGVNLSVFGGTKLGAPPFTAQDDPLYGFNERLGTLCANQFRPDGLKGWSIATGGGPGLAMKGPHFCLRRARKGVPNCMSKCIAVASSLESEVPHEYIDADVMVRPQGDTFFRERMIAYLGWDAMIFYPGYWGTQYELLAAIFDVYCQGRDVVSHLARRASFDADTKLRSPYPGPIILVDRVVGKPERRGDPPPRFWDPITRLHDNSKTIGVLKSDAPVPVYTVLDTDADGPERVVSQVLDHLSRRRGMAIRDTIRNGG